MKVTYDSRIFDKKSFKSQCNILIKTKIWVQRQEARNAYLIYSDLTKNCIQMFFFILKQNSKNIIVKKLFKQQWPFKYLKLKTAFK